MANQETNVQIQDDDQMVTSTADSVPIVKLPLKANNVQVLLDPNTYLNDYRVMIEFLQFHPLNRALTLTNPNIPEIYVQELWQTMYDKDEETLIGSFGHPITTDDAVSIPITKRKIAKVFRLPQPVVEIDGQQVPNPVLQPNPTSEALIDFLYHLGYNEHLPTL